MHGAIGALTEGFEQAKGAWQAELRDDYTR
jgi:hypothetical protein